jgi:hypothetical protein
VTTRCGALNYAVCCSAIGADSGMRTRVITKTGDGELAKLAAYVESVYGTSLELTGGL